MHIGGAFGGHYYVYIKNFEDGQWYKFNDSSVYFIDINEITEKVYGGKSNNAYMLFYRQLNGKEEYKFTMPEDIIELINNENIQIEVPVE